MSPEQFKIQWINSEDNFLSPINVIRLSKFNLLSSTTDFLNKSGLPNFTSPFLNFALDSDEAVYGINNLMVVYPFLDDKSTFEKYIVIGSCRDGDVIAINTAKQDQIEELDHEDNFNSMFFNTSICTLADYLIIYKNFELSVLKEHGEDKYKNGYFTDLQFDEMRNAMLKADSRALSEIGFWREELEINLSIRQEYLNNK